MVNNEDRLLRRPVTPAFSQGAISVISAGLEPGERLVVSDATPAVEGMLVEATLDTKIAEQLSAQAAGEGDMR